MRFITNKKYIINISFFIVGASLTMLSIFLLQGNYLARIDAYLIRNNIFAPTVPPMVIIKSNYYDFKMTPYVVDVNGLRSSSRYGGIDSLDGNLVFIDGDGIFYKLTNEKFDQVIKSNLKNSKEDFAKDYKDNFLGVYFGVKDILLIKNESDKNVKVFISSVDYDSAKQCYFLSVFSNELISSNFTFLNREWIKIFSTRPCLSKHKKGNFLGQSSGGRLVVDSGKKNIFLSTGDFYFDGVNEKNILQNDFSDYGKVIKIPLTPNAKPVAVAEGFRNPQGLFYTSKGLYVSEHGPQGGDNVNFVDLTSHSETVQNFGWPFATFGVDYGTKEWPLDRLNDNKGKFKLPVFSWTPSIGVSNLIMVKSTTELVRWNESLLVSSLKDKSMYLMKLENNRVYTMEKINIGIRVRDIIQINNDFYLLEDADNPIVWKLSLFVQ